MILKFNLPTGGWKFIEGVREPSIKYLEAEDVQNVKAYHESYLSFHSVIDDKILLKEQHVSAKKDIHLVEIWYKDQKNENYSSILIDTVLFLMNDEGKTIERI